MKRTSRFPQIGIRDKALSGRLAFLSEPLCELRKACALSKAVIEPRALASRASQKSRREIEAVVGASSESRGLLRAAASGCIPSAQNLGKLAALASFGTWTKAASANAISAPSSSCPRYARTFSTTPLRSSASAGLETNSKPSKTKAVAFFIYTCPR